MAEAAKRAGVKPPETDNAEPAAAEEEKKEEQPEEEEKGMKPNAGNGG